MNIIPIQQWYDELKNVERFLIAGPCSAESKEQVMETAKGVSRINTINAFRAGIWKPRTNPNSFEGVGKIGLDWLADVKKKYGLRTIIEVATPEHVEIVLKHPNPPDMLWLGARTTANPFSVQAVADALKGVDIPVFVKNPIIPELKLWIGAIQRLYKNGIQKLAAIHRGFYPYEQTKYRNLPKWELLIDFKTQFPEIQVVGDPSHIAGKRSLLEDVMWMFVCLNVDGLFIETHYNPELALSDKEQQVTPAQLEEILKKIKFRLNNTNDIQLNSELKKFRFSIDSVDYQLMELLSRRMDLVKKIGLLKKDSNLSIFQLERWKEIVSTRLNIGDELHLDRTLVKKVIKMLHQESINLQSNLFKNEDNE